MESIVDTARPSDCTPDTQAALGGADIATIPPQVLPQMVARVRTGPTERSPRPGSSSPLASTFSGRPAQRLSPCARQS